MKLLLCTGGDPEASGELSQIKIFKNKKADSLKSAFFICTGGETRTLTPHGTRS